LNKQTFKNLKQKYAAATFVPERIKISFFYLYNMIELEGRRIDVYGGRLRLPKSLIDIGYIDPDEIKFVAYEPNDGCLGLYTEQQFRKLPSEWASGSSSDDVAAAERMVSRYSGPARIDKRYRVKIPAPVREQFGTREVRFVLDEGSIEIWPARSSPVSPGDADYAFVSS